MNEPVKNGGRKKKEDGRGPGCVERREKKQEDGRGPGCVERREKITRGWAGPWFCRTEGENNKRMGGALVV